VSAVQEVACGLPALVIGVREVRRAPVRDLARANSNGLEPIGFVDDDLVAHLRHPAPEYMPTSVSVPARTASPCADDY
jgi:hypothetical protein